MRINLAEVTSTLERLMEVESKFGERTETIGVWIKEHRREISKNHLLVKNKSKKNDIQILIIFLQCLLVRAIKGEAGIKVYNELKNTIKSIDDLHRNNYKKILRRSQYRWGNAGLQVIENVVEYFSEKLDWDWNAYFNEANNEKNNNFLNDEILKIKNIGFKLRDLALSNFNPSYAAFDLHVTRVVTRIGWLNHGYDLLKNNHLEMGNNPSDEKNYLFLHRLFLKLSEMTKRKFTPVDLDRIFWHLGKSKCAAKPNCKHCPINDVCLTGQYRV